MNPDAQKRQFPLDASILQRLDRLTLLTRRTLATGHPGRRRSPRAGSSLEFADFRRYSPGDDFRRIDWRVYARLERLFLRVFAAEENIPVTLLLDCSDSMYYGSPAKIELARTLVAALAYITLSGEDSVIVGALTDRLVTYRKVGNSKHAIWNIAEFLQKLPHSGITDLNKALSDVGQVVTAPGITIILSDLLAPHGYQRGLRLLQQLHQEVALLHILAPEELDPPLQGDWRLRDSEGERAIDVSISAHVLHAYRERLASFCEEIAAFAHTHQATYTLISSDLRLLDVVQTLLRQITLLK